MDQGKRLDNDRLKTTSPKITNLVLQQHGRAGATADMKIGARLVLHEMIVIRIQAGDVGDTSCISMQLPQVSSPCRPHT